MSLTSEYLLDDVYVSRGSIDRRIENHEFDVIIIMGIFTESDRKRLCINDGEYPYFNVISEYYEKSEIVFIDGNCNNDLKKYVNQGICFSKEF